MEKGQPFSPLHANHQTDEKEALSKNILSLNMVFVVLEVDEITIWTADSNMKHIFFCFFPSWDRGRAEWDKEQQTDERRGKLLLKVISEVICTSAAQ